MSAKNSEPGKRLEKAWRVWRELPEPRKADIARSMFCYMIGGMEVSKDTATASKVADMFERLLS